MSGWQPIETAPFVVDSATGGKWIKQCLLWFPDEFGGVIVSGQMDADEWLIAEEGRTFHLPFVGGAYVEPTHWMPLPEPPSE